MAEITMGFWPFGRDPANIELVSRVITASTQNGYRLRGKLTIHFQRPQRKAEADDAGDRCAALAVAMLREAPDHERVIGAEAQLSAHITARYPTHCAPARAVELAALHVVGDPALSDELRRASSGTMQAVQPPSGRQSSPSLGPATSRPPPSAPGPPSSGGPARSTAAAGPPSQGVPSVRRRSSQIRSIQALLMPPGTSPAAMGQFVAPIVRDSAARLLIGFLRAHDLISVRGVSIDEGSAEMLATLVPASDAPPGGYEASRAVEIARWQGTLGQGAMFALHREVRVRSAYLAKEALAHVEVMPALADAVTESLCTAAFPDEAGLLAEMSRLPSPIPADFVRQLAQTLIRLAGSSDDPAALTAALTPLVATVREDLDVSAMIIKQSSGG
jgi:hypothetical protein